MSVSSGSQIISIGGENFLLPQEPEPAQKLVLSQEQAQQLLRAQEQAECSTGLFGKTTLL